MQTVNIFLKTELTAVACLIYVLVNKMFSFWINV